MPSRLVRKLKPEEEELSRKRDELAALHVRLAERELELAELRRQLSAFESIYMREVGTLYAELDLWNARIAEFEAQMNRSSDSAEKARAAREHARQNYEEARGKISDAPRSDPSPDLKRLFREVAKRFHPDLAKDEAEYEERARYMVEANRAYRAGDADALQRILENADYADANLEFRDDVATELVRVIRQISRAKARLREIDEELNRLRESELALLMTNARDAQQLGRDLIAELSAKVTAQIRVARKRYETLQENVRS
jgi:hypothetical protein